MRGYTGSQEAAQRSQSGARPVLEVLGWSPVSHEGLYIIIQKKKKKKSFFIATKQYIIGREARRPWPEAIRN